MATRPVFVPRLNGGPLAQECFFEFGWSGGFAESQKKKNVVALHAAAKQGGIENVLEISSKSEEKVGRRLSAFSLKLDCNGVKYPLESVYQGSKVFEKKGPFPEVFNLEPREAKRFIREMDNGRLIGFEFEQKRYPLNPKNAFYDWIYIRALADHSVWIQENVHYDGYTDIEFNPDKQVNCQARAFAEFKSLAARSKLDAAVNDFDLFASMLPSV